ncbi:MAG TPA: hypothetical protein VE093_17395 [Polyangiaceae bacterium]|nr:hypothetical protein [Polyangiaceae bacterium]
MLSDNAIKSQYRVARLGEGDVRRCTDHWIAFERRLLNNDHMYPGIYKWVHGKVAPGLSSQRVAYVAYFNEKPIASAVLKRGARAKYCHLNIDDEHQEHGLGEFFFSLMSLEVRNSSQEIHFTLPEGLWEQRHSFFASFGFADAIPSRHQYRLFERELRCSASVGVVMTSVMEKWPRLLSKFSVHEDLLSSPLLLSVRPKYASKILDGSKSVEIRRAFSTKWAGQRVVLYASDPVSSLVGEAHIANVVPGTPGKLWDAFHDHIGCTKEDFDSYTGSSGEIFAIILRDPCPYTRPIHRKEISGILGEKLHPPQSYTCLERNRPWTRAVSIAEALQSSSRHPLLVL